MKGTLTMARTQTSTSACTAWVLGAVLALSSGPGMAQSKPKAHLRKPAPVAMPAPVDPVLSERDLGVAARVHVGTFPCDLGSTVRLEPDTQANGFFHLHLNKDRYRMHPVESRTGAIRLEDPVQGVVWIQLGNKSMLMSQKLGRRLADECMGDVQRQVAEALKTNPAPSLFEPLPNPPAAAATTTGCNRNPESQPLTSGVETC